MLAVLTQAYSTVKEVINIKLYTFHSFHLSVFKLYLFYKLINVYFLNLFSPNLGRKSSADDQSIFQLAGCAKSNYYFYSRRLLFLYSGRLLELD